MKSIDNNSDRTVDWAAVKARLASVALAQAANDQRSAAETQQILADRAALLAEIPNRTPDASEIVELVTFQLGQDAFSIETHFVREVIRPRDISVVPGVPAFLVGVTILHGEVLAIIDVRQFFGSQAQPDPDSWRVIVLGQDRAEFGIVADLVKEVSIRRTEEILGVPPSVLDEGRQYLKGVMADAMLVLDGSLLLEDSRLYVDQDD